ncbi:unnamed protein product [Diamesa serratosioi]
MKHIWIVVCFSIIGLVATESINNTDKDNVIINESLVENDSILMRITEAFNVVKNEKCLKDLNDTLSGYLNKKPWAIAMFDSSVKVPTGIEYGSNYHFGNFDQCMNIETNIELDGVNIKPKYCLADVVMDGYNVRHSATRIRMMKNTTTIHWGICMPSSCSNEDIKNFLAASTGRKVLELEPSLCQTKEKIKYSKTDIAFGCVILLFVSIVMFSTMFHIYIINMTEYKKLRSNVFIEEVVKSFSIVENIQKLGKKSNDDLGLSCINGIKAICMFFIVAGHALVFMVGGPVQNTEFYEKQSVMVQNAFLQNSPLLVDSFLLLSGFLFARLILIELDKRRGKINFGLLYVFRYIRLTPAYFAMIGLYSTWFIKIGNGPLWKSRLSMEQERCQASWWTNLLYINNYIGNDSLCMFQSWYLAADTQLFILAPLMIYPLWKCRKTGLGLLAIVAAITVFVPFYITFTNNLDPTFIVWADEVSDLSANDYFINSYGKTHMRATSYVFGLLVGFLAHYIHDQKYNISNSTRKILWLTSIIIGIYSMYSVTLYYIPTYKYTHLESAMYNSLHRLGWSFFFGWLVLACVTSENGSLKKFLSSQALVPISRLTYCAYLTNGFIELYLLGSIRTPKFMSVTNLLGETLSHVCLTFLAAFVLCLIFESPIHGIEKMLLRRNAPSRERRSSGETDDLNTRSRTPSTSEASA